MARAKLGNVEVGEDKPVRIMYALNLSPDTFYKGSLVRGAREAVGKASKALGDGAHIIDMGAMSTGPTSKPVSAKQEMHRLIPVIRALARELDAPISADTQRAGTAEAAIEAGATVVNDISGLKADARMAEIIAGAGCSALLMAAEQAPGDVYRVGEIKRALRGSVNICRRYGIPLDRVVLDPAVGYWPARLARLGPRARKPFKGRPYPLAAFLDLRILARLGELKTLGRPLCVGISRKSFIGGVLGLSRPEDRLVGSLAATVTAVLNGASVIRTHDVRETLQAVRVAGAIRDAGGRR